MNKIKNKIKYFLNNFKPKISEEETYAINICLNMIKKSDVQMFISPISHKRYIKDETNGMFIIIDSQMISIINHVYMYNINIFDIKNVEELNKSFDLELEKRRNELENEIKTNIKHSLEKILKGISE